MQLSVSGPFSQGSVRLLSDGAFFDLRDGKGGSARASTADELLLKATGLQVPVGGLRYWILGLPAPGGVQQPVHDAQGRLQSLRQNGWNIRYRAYMADDVDGLSLPRKLFLDRDGLRVRLVVERWQL
jgi:outer membrane lipoprotein LolB